MSPRKAVTEFDPGVTFGAAAAPAAPPVDAQQLMARLTQLQRDVQAADRERAAAEAGVAQAQKDLREIDEQLKALKVNPDTAAEALTQLEQQLAADVAKLEQQVAEERKHYQQIAAAVQ